MLPTSTELTYFLEIGNTLNISRAAERLGISQPTLSLAVRRLEDSFGVALLLRTKSGVKLTHAGRKLHGNARSLLMDWERLRDDAAKDETEIRGRYTIGAHPSVALYAFPFFLRELLETHASLELKLEHDLSRKITEDVISFKTDFGIVVNPWEHPDLIIKILCKDEVTLYTRKTPSKLQQIGSGREVLICDPELAQSQSLLRQLSKKNLNFTRIINSSNLEVITAMVAEGVGIGILPGRVAGRAHAELKPITKDAPKFIDTHCLVYRADMQKSKASRAIAKWIEEKMLGGLSV